MSNSSNSRKPRFKLLVLGPEYGFTSKGFGLLTDIWLIEVNQRIPFQLTAFSRDEDGHAQGVSACIRKLMKNAATECC